MYDKTTDHIFLYSHLYTNCTLGIRHPADGRNMLLQNNNMGLNVIIDVLLSVYHIIIQHSSMYRNKTYEIQDTEALSRASCPLSLAERGGASLLKSLIHVLNPRPW